MKHDCPAKKGYMQRKVERVIRECLIIFRTVAVLRMFPGRRPFTVRYVERSTTMLRVSERVKTTGATRY